jgi:hypothetical protein
VPYTGLPASPSIPSRYVTTFQSAPHCKGCESLNVIREPSVRKKYESTIHANSALLRSVLVLAPVPSARWARERLRIAGSLRRSIPKHIVGRACAASKSPTSSSVTTRCARSGCNYPFRIHRIHRVLRNISVYGPCCGITERVDRVSARSRHHGNSASYCKNSANPPGRDTFEIWNAC